MNSKASASSSVRALRLEALSILRFTRMLVEILGLFPNQQCPNWENPLEVRALYFSLVRGDNDNSTRQRISAIQNRYFPESDDAEPLTHRVQEGWERYEEVCRGCERKDLALVYLKRWEEYVSRAEEPLPRDPTNSARFSLRTYPDGFPGGQTLIGRSSAESISKSGNDLKPIETGAETSETHGISTSLPESQKAMSLTIDSNATDYSGFPGFRADVSAFGGTGSPSASAEDNVPSSMAQPYTDDYSMFPADYLLPGLSSRSHPFPAATTPQTASIRLIGVVGDDEPSGDSPYNPLFRPGWW